LQKETAEITNAMLLCWNKSWFFGGKLMLSVRQTGTKNPRFTSKVYVTKWCLQDVRCCVCYIVIFLNEYERVCEITMGWLQRKGMGALSE
jgi:hypothetical protein